MDFSFFYDNLIPKIHLYHYNFYSFYKGFDTLSFLSKIINNIKDSNLVGSIYLINYSNIITDSLSKYNINVQKKNIKKDKINTNGIYSISERLMLLNLISYKISKESVAAIIFSENTLLNKDSKALFIIKLISSYTKIIVIFICNNPLFFSENVKYFMEIINPNFNEINFEFIPRFNKVIDKIISYFFQSKYLIENEKISIEEYNLEFEENNPLFQVQKLLKKLISIIIKEICNCIQSEKYIDELNKYFEKYINIDIYDKEIYKNFSEFNPKIRVLFFDLENIKVILKGIDSLDLNMIYYNFKKLQRLSINRSSIFSYEDSETEQIINNINNILKSNLYKIESISNISEDEQKLINQFLEYKIIKDLNINEKFFEEILTSYQIILNDNIFDFICKKYFKLVEILSQLNNSNENILIIVKNDIIKDNIKLILVSKFVLNDNYHLFFNSIMERFLYSKDEFLKRYNIISNNKFNNKSNMFIENLLLQFLSYKIAISTDEKRKKIFDKILQEYLYDKDSIKKDLLPSEIADDLTEEDYEKFDNTIFHEDQIIKNKHIEIISLNKKNFLENCILLQNTLYQRDYNKIILFNTMIDIIRFLECFIIQNESSIKSLININVTNSYSFNQELNYIKYEFDKFLLNLNFHKEYVKLSNEKRENKMEIESKNKIEHISNILVDNREMGASTPFYLYQKGFNINVGQLEVGDYILSNSLCIERKSISTGDIFQSLKSHHLTDQIIKMLKYYGYIIILLEFENFEDIIKIINNGNLFSQISLYKKFLELKNVKKDLENNKMIFIWSLSPKMTAQIIIYLKIKYNDQFLDIEKCINMNKIEKNIEKKTYIDNFINQNDDNNDINNENNIEKKKKRLMISIEHFLRRIDGIDNLNINIIFNTFKNLNDLIQYPENQLYETLGRLSGNKIQKYLNQPYN